MNVSHRIELLILVILLTTPLVVGVTTSKTLFTFNVPTSRAITLTYGGSCSASAFFFNEGDANFDPDNDGNAAKVKPRNVRFGEGGDFCQASNRNAMFISNVGNVTVNLDGNFTNVFSPGPDSNLILKVWQGAGPAGCGSDGNGLGGWEQTCSVTSATEAPTTTTCKDFSGKSDATTGSRLWTSLTTSPIDAAYLCFSGDFNSFVSGGDHNNTFQIGSEFS